ncbi:DNA repair protein endonuclease SAE2/CtIP C-terminus-domain-containing protein [Apodospora peruviana]|uniref:DNA repair protein endonuclease SAE2/CtIP C-terminus-domain-containing protein n=1 Tax=Apodospora peruviana TaxID=516989 RepID=A0AAE0IIL1_9PEZI|nr:DNA repair protein endonuclease SAE2/CtIP C-terminus-domain-containing protein [Apodospora peruviana]
MGFWDQMGRQAIIAAVEVACDTVGGNLAAELHDRDQTRHAFLTEEVDRLKAGAGRAEELEKENQRLSRELNELREKFKQSASFPANDHHSSNGVAPATPHITPPGLARQSGRPKTRQVLGELSVNTGSRPLHDLSPFGHAKSVSKKAYNKLLKANTELERRLEVKALAGKVLKEERDGWMMYAESLESKVKGLERRLRGQGKIGDWTSSDTVSSSVPRPIPAESVRQTTGEADEVILAMNPSLVSSLASNPDESTGPKLHQDAVEQLRQSRRAVSTLAVSLICQEAEKRNEHGDPLAKDDTPDDTEDERSDELPGLPQQTDVKDDVIIKPEPSSDGPTVGYERGLRKRKSMDNIWLPPARRIKNEHSIGSDPVVTGDSVTFSPYESIDLDSGRGGVLTPRKLRHLEFETPCNNTAVGRKRHPLQPLFIGLRDELETPRIAVTQPNRSRPASGGHRSGDGNGWTLKHGVADVAEDGTYGLKDVSSKSGRLRSLLEQPTPEVNAVVLKKMALASGGHRSETREPDITEAPRPEKFIQTPAGRSRAPNVLHGSSKRTPRFTALREQPLAELRLEDFKINPKSNNGHKYAFDEVVRNKADRAELAGCTDPNCCGKVFGGIAKSELTAGGAGFLKKVENIKLLEDFLGHEAYRLAVMTGEEKQEVWLQAKTQDLANRMGRHRHRFARRPSPPGYWNPDFPTTQEIVMRKDEGEKMERKQVEERWREAMRGGGRWLFQDE